MRLGATTPCRRHHRLPTPPLRCSRPAVHGLGTPSARVDGLTEHRAETITEAVRLFAVAEKARSTKATLLNARSSRSHCVTIIRAAIEGVAGRLTIFDMAGSECIEASGACPAEAGYINKSVAAVGLCVASMRSAEARVPFRGLNITEVLGCLISGASARLVVAVMISASRKMLPQTRASLRFLQDALSIAPQRVRPPPGPVGGAAAAPRSTAHGIPRRIHASDAMSARLSRKISLFSAAAGPRVAASPAPVGPASSTGAPVAMPAPLAEEVAVSAVPPRVRCQSAAASSGGGRRAVASSPQTPQYRDCFDDDEPPMPRNLRFSAGGAAPAAPAGLSGAALEAFVNERTYALRLEVAELMAAHADAVAEASAAY